MNLIDLRKQINDIDEKMLELFEKRMEISKNIALVKKENALPIFDSKREKEVIARNVKNLNNKELESYYVSYLEKVMKISKQYQNFILSGESVGYSGIVGSYGYLAALKAFGSAKLVSYGSFKKAYESCENGEVDVCILPIENSSNGDVGEVMDLLFNGSLYINDIIDLEISHVLLGKKGSKLEDIKKVMSHPQALGQCNMFIDEKGYDRIEEVNTAVACEKLSKSDSYDTAVIASKECANLYDLEILKEDITLVRSNTTRFVVLSKAKPETKDKNVCSIIVYTVKNTSGALAKTLNIIGAHDYNMRSLRSRPLKRLMWNYYFFVELEGSVNTINGKEMLQELSSICDELKALGTYKIEDLH